MHIRAIDSFKVSEVCAYLHFLVCGHSQTRYLLQKLILVDYKQVASVPVQVIIAVTLLYQILGWSSIVGIGVMVLLLPINYWISSGFSKIQQVIMSSTDKRIQATNEVLQNIRIIKFFAWEERFAQIVDEARVAELKALRRRYILWAIAGTYSRAGRISILISIQPPCGMHHRLLSRSSVS